MCIQIKPSNTYVTFFNKCLIFKRCIMNSKVLRVEKTENALLDALFETLSTKEFKQITVQDLCDKALVRRSTF